MIKKTNHNNNNNDNNHDCTPSLPYEEQLFFSISTKLKLQEKLMGAELLHEVTRLIEEEDNELALEILNTARENLKKKLKNLSCFLVMGIIITGMMIFVFNSTCAYASSSESTSATNKNLQLLDDDDDDDKKSSDSIASTTTIMTKSIGNMAFPLHAKHCGKGKSIFHMKARIRLTEFAENIDPRLLIFKFVPLYLYNRCFV